MSKLDIRKDQSAIITEIVFAEDNPSFDNIIDISTKEYYGDIRVIEFWDAQENSMRVDVRDVENLIKALQKAIELGWTK